MRSKRKSPSSSKDADPIMFFKVYFPDRSSHQLELPSAFVKRLKCKIPPRSLVCSRNRSWPVDVKKLNNAVHFENGWSDFVRDSSLEPGDFLVFSYLGTRFNVKIYGKSGCEKTTSYARKEIKIEMEGDEAMPHHQYEQTSGRGQVTNDLNDSSVEELDSGEGRNDLSNEKLPSGEGTNNLSGEKLSSDGHRESMNSFTNENKQTNGHGESINLTNEYELAIGHGESINNLTNEDEQTHGYGERVNNFRNKDELTNGHRESMNNLIDENEQANGHGESMNMNNLTNEDEPRNGRVESIKNLSDEEELSSGEGTDNFSEEDELYSGESTVNLSDGEELSSGDSEGSWESEKRIRRKKKDNRVKKRPRFSTKQKGKDPNTSPNKVRAVVAYGKSSYEYPYFKIGVLPVYIYHGSLNIPMPFAQKYLKVGKVETSLQVMNKSWPVTLTTYRNGCCKISSGWLAFVRDNYIDEGDICVFELIDTSAYTFRVSIFPLYS